MGSFMKFAGIDIGSRTIELVVIENGNTVMEKMADSGFDPLVSARELLQTVQYDRLITTGYGRSLLEIAEDIETVTEIKAYAVGVRRFYPDCRTLLDIGGQDVKVISLSPEGRVRKFEMNDRCAAGSGRFLEIMARNLGYTIEEFGEEALKGTRNVRISSMCTVFAESEVTSLLHKGEDRREIALGLHRSITDRVVGMLNRIAAEEPVVFAGGVARNPCMRQLLEEALKTRVRIPEQPHMVGAYGAAMIAGQRETDHLPPEKQTQHNP